MRLFVNKKIRLLYECNAMFLLLLSKLNWQCHKIGKCGILQQKKHDGIGTAWAQPAGTYRPNSTMQKAQATIISFYFAPKDSHFPQKKFKSGIEQ